VITTEMATKYRSNLSEIILATVLIVICNNFQSPDHLPLQKVYIAMSDYSTKSPDHSGRTFKPPGRPPVTSPATPIVTARQRGSQITIVKGGAPPTAAEAPESPSPKPSVTHPSPLPSVPIALGPRRITRSQPPQSDLAVRLSLSTFVSQFEDGKSFNDTDIGTLGLDLHCDKPMFPALQSILSDAPLGERSCHPIPDCYRAVVAPVRAQEKTSLFTDQTLLFIFETEPRTAMQLLAADELQRRGFVYDDATEKWRTPRSRVWDAAKWAEVEPQALSGSD
jgi:hypothetical protein